MPKTTRNPPRPTHTNLHLPTTHPAQAQILAHPAPHKLLRAGRRFGKTTLAADYLSYGLLELAAPTAYLAPTYKMLQTQWRALKATFAPLIQTKSETEHWLQLTTGGQLTMWSLDLNPDAVRGQSFASLFIDEAAMIRNLKQTWHQVLLPTLLDRNGHALIVSTPRAKTTSASSKNPAPSTPSTSPPTPTPSSPPKPSKPWRKTCSPVPSVKRSTPNTSTTPNSPSGNGTP